MLTNYRTGSDSHHETKLSFFQMLTGVAGAVAAYALNCEERGEPDPRERRPRGVDYRWLRAGWGWQWRSDLPVRGIKLVLAARDIEELTEARNTLFKRRRPSDEDVLLIPADLTDPAQAASLVEHAIDHFGRIDVLINNAGIIGGGPRGGPVGRGLSSRHVNEFFRGALYDAGCASVYALPGRRNRASIVNIGSVGGKVAVPHMLPYTASKFALVGFSEGLHAELRHKGVRVTTVCPG